MTNTDATGARPTTAEEIRAWLMDQIAAILSLPQDEIDADVTFDAFGLASRDAVSLSGDLEDFLNRRLSPTLLYQYPTINKLAEHLAGPAAHAPSGNAKGDAPRGASATLEEADVAKMSEEEAEAALLRKLLELDE